MLKDKRGFSLVELLVVVVIMGMVITAVLGLYVNVQRSTGTTEDIAEVQQTLRVALDRIARDVVMSGFLVGIGNPITDAEADTMTTVTATSFDSFARIATGNVFLAGSSGAVTIAVDNAAMAQLVSDSGYVRIVNPLDGCQRAEPTSGSCGDGNSPFFQVTSVNTSDTNPTLTLKPKLLAGAPLAVQDYSPLTDIKVSVGDMIVQVPSPASDSTFPNPVTYALNSGNLLRNNLALADKMTGLQFDYLMDDGGIEPVAPATSVSAGRLAHIVAVRVTLTGATPATAQEAAKTRQIQSTIKLRNK